VLEARAARLIPWAWAANGTLSVISAVGAALLALDRGFAIVITAGAACYLGAACSLAGGASPLGAGEGDEEDLAQVLG